jgi:hypothetical protein
MTVHDHNEAEARAVVSTAPVVLFVDPHTGYVRVIVGQALLDGDPTATVAAAQLSVETESEGPELELATAAVLAIRGAVDDASAEQLRPLANVIQKYWNRGLRVPWTAMLAYDAPDPSEE